MIIKGVSGRNGRVVALVLFLSFIVVPGVSAAQDGFVDLGVGLSYTLEDGSTDVDVGDNVDFTLEITNHGDVTAEDVRGGIDFPIGYVIVDHPPGCFRDDVEIFVACDIDPLAPGETTDITVTGQATESGTFEVDGGALINPSNPFSETDPQDNNFEVLMVSVGEGEEPLPMSDLAVTKDGPDFAIAGELVKYTIVVTNNGPDTATDITVRDTVLQGTTIGIINFIGEPVCTNIGPDFRELECQIDELESGESTMETVFVESVNASDAPKQLINTVTIENPELHGDTNTGNDRATSFTLLTVSADVSVTKDGPTTAVVGEEFVYTIEVTNNGPGEASGIAFDDEIPLAEINNVTSTDLDCEVVGSDGIDVASCFTTGLDSGETATASISVTPIFNDTIRNTVEVTTNSFDPDLSNNIDEAPRVTVGNPGSGGGSNPFLDASDNPLSRRDVVNKVIEWNFNGSIDGIPFTRRDIILSVIEWNIANTS